MSRHVIEFREMQPASTRVARLIDTLRVLERPAPVRFSLVRTLRRWRKSLHARPKPTLAKLDIVFVRQTRSTTSEVSSFE